MFKKLIISLVSIVLIVLFSATYYFSPVLNAGSGFSAKNICSGHFLSGLSGQVIVEEALKPASDILANISFRIDEENRQVDTSLFGFFQRRAVYSEGTGCTLLSADHQELQRKVDVADFSKPNSDLVWPQGVAPTPENKELQPVLEQAFAEPDPVYERNTKAVVVIHKGQLVAEKYAPGIDASTPLIGWSMTKSVTNLLVGLLVYDGLLTLEKVAPVPLWHLDADDPRGAITMDQLLRMSSGLVFDEEYGLYSDVTRMLSVEADAAGFAASKSLLTEPGSLWAYSSGTSNIISGIIKRTVGGSFQDYFNFTQKRLFLPLGIHSAAIETDDNGTFIGSSFMYASARDWARLGQFCLQGGQWQGKQLLPEDWLSYSTTPTANNPLNNYGAHFWLNADPEDRQQKRSWPSLPADTFSMNGYQGQRVVIVPSKDLVVVRLGFSAGKKRGIEQLVAGVIEVLAP
jgi:CubicO group peptidase (beta-lactamase class C family)